MESWTVTFWGIAFLAVGFLVGGWMLSDAEDEPRITDHERVEPDPHDPMVRRG